VHHDSNAYQTNSGVVDVKVMCMEREKQALLKLKDDLVDENDQLSSWGTSDDCCNS
jgi:hypothetical protein